VNKTAFYGFALLALTVLIVLPVADSVNATGDANTGLNSVLLASGSPMPPPVPNAVNESALVASGSPMPPPVPNAVNESALVASGSPMPPPVPNAVSGSALLASTSPV
jgi:hypothetical protein